LANHGENTGNIVFIVIIALISASIAGINLLTMFGIIRSPDILTYAVFIGLILIPSVIIGSALNKVFVEQKKVLKNILEKNLEAGYKIGLKKISNRIERVLAERTIHPLFYFKIAVASMLSVLAGLLTFIISMEITIETFLIMNPVLIFLIFLLSIIHIFSKGLFKPNGWEEFLEHTWIALFTIALSISFMVFLKDHVRSAYPRSFWENFLGLPFSLQTIMFLIILLLIGGILIRLGDVLKFDSSPFKASGVSLVLVSMFFLVPQFQFIPLETFFELIVFAFSIFLILYGIFTTFLLYKYADVKYLVTSERLMVLKTNRLENSLTYPLNRFSNIGISQGSLEKKFGYGNVNILFRTSKRKKTEFCVLHGVKKPNLLANTIRSQGLRERKKMKPKKKKVKKKRPGKKTKKTPTRGSKDNFYYRLVTPLIIISILMLTISPTSSVEGDDPSDIPDIEESHEIVFENLTRVDMHSNYNIYRMDINGTPLTSEDIREDYKESDEEGKDRLERNMLNHTDSLIENSMDVSFDLYNLSKGTYSYTRSIDRYSLEQDDDGPIIIVYQTEISFYPDYYELPEESDLQELIIGALKIGGLLEKDIPLFCKEGHTIYYKIHAPPTLYFLEQESNYVELELDNRHGDNPRKENRLVIVHDDPIELKEETSDLKLLLDIYELVRKSDREYLSVKMNFTSKLNYLPIPRTLQQKLPESISINQVNPDMIRLLYRNGFDMEIEDFFTEIEGDLTDELESHFVVKEQGRLKTFGLDVDYDIDSMDSKTPIRIYFNSSLEKTLYEEQAQSTLIIQRRYLVDQTISFELSSFQNFGLDYTIIAPEGIELISGYMDDTRLSIQQDGSGRYFVQDRVPIDSSVTIRLTVGTHVDIFSLLPFIILIIILFLTWIWLNIKPIKKKRKRWR